jgi:uncharacterized protein
VAIPDRGTALRILDDAELPNGIRRHSEGVARVAVEAARMVAEAGIFVDAALVEAAALLHDIDKPIIRRRGGLHGEVAAEMLAQMGYPELAGPVASHPVACLLDDARSPRGWPSVLLAIADRRVAQSFVTIEERLADMAARHPRFRAQIEAARAPAQALERELVEVTRLDPHTLQDRLRSAWRAGAETAQPR